MSLLSQVPAHVAACTVLCRPSSGAARAVVMATIAVLTLVPAANAQNIRQWSPAVSVDPERQNGVNTSVNDGCPSEAPDGHVLFLASNRVPGAPGAKDLDIWLAYRFGEDDPWGSPEQLPEPVNTAAAEFCPTPLAGNQLLFVSTRLNTCGEGNDADIYYTRLRMSPIGWIDPVALPCDAVTGSTARSKSSRRRSSRPTAGPSSSSRATARQCPRCA